jgi:hypothetical protein
LQRTTARRIAGQARTLIRTPSRARDLARRRLAGRAFDSRLVWILGSPRSGSTWLLQLLGEHPAVVPINEPLIGWYLGPFLSDLPGWSTSLDGTNFTMRKVQEDKRHQFFAREFEDVVIPALGEMMRRRFLAHALRYPAEAGPSRCSVVIKEPNGSQSADLILPALPKARVLFLLRDGRDVVDSELAANQEGSWVSAEFPGARGISSDQRHDFVVRSAQKWLWRTQVVQDAMRVHEGPTRILKYEELLAEPATHLAQLFDWLEQPLDSGSLERILDKHAFDRVPQERRGPDKFFRAATPGLWRQNLTAEEQASLSQLLDPKLRELGYETGA